MTETGPVRRRRPPPNVLPPADQLRRHLRPGEKLRWSGRPDPRIYAASKMQPGYYGLLMVAFWLVWLLVALFQETPTFLVKMEAVGYSLPFLLPGLWLLSIPLRHGLNSRSMAYGITDRRLIIAAEKPAPRLMSFAPKDIRFIQRFDYDNGLSSILFGYEFSPKRRAWQRRVVWSRTGFFGIGEAAAAEELITALAQLRSPEG